MAKTLYAPTEDFIKNERTILGADVSGGSNVSLTLENNDQLAQNDFLCIGYEGNELCELVQVNAAVSGSTSVQVATLKFAHKKGEPVVRFKYDKRKFYGATSSSGSYTELTSDGSPKTIQVDDPQGTLLEYSGATYTHFKATYYNSQTTAETDADDSVATEADESKRYSSIYAIRKHAGLAGNPLYSDGRIEVKRKQAENEINSTLFGRYVLPLSGVPPFLSYICELLAAGYIDYEEFGADGQGVKWLGEARAILKQFQTGERKLILEDGTEATRVSTTGVITGLPSASTNEESIFTIDQKY